MSLSIFYKKWKWQEHTGADGIYYKTLYKHYSSEALVIDSHHKKLPTININTNSTLINI